MFSLLFSNAPFSIKIIQVIAFVIAIAFAITAHEFAHSLVAYKCGDPTPKYNGRLSMNPLSHLDPLGFILLVAVGFGWAKPVAIDPTNFRHQKRGLIMVSLAGVVTNILLAALVFCPLFYVVDKFIPSDFVLFNFLNQLTSFLFTTNIVLAVFNLLPIYPLDGFNLIETLVGPYNKYCAFMRRYGQFIMLGLLVVGGFFINALATLIANPILHLWGLIFR